MSILLRLPVGYIIGLFIWKKVVSGRMVTFPAELMNKVDEAVRCLTYAKWALFKLSFTKLKVCLLAEPSLLVHKCL